MTASPHWTAQALSADSRPGELERLLGVLIVAESALSRIAETGIYLDRRQVVLAVKEVQ